MCSADVVAVTPVVPVVAVRPVVPVVAAGAPGVAVGVAAAAVEAAVGAASIGVIRVGDVVVAPGDLVEASLNLPIGDGSAALAPGTAGTLRLYQPVQILAAGLTADTAGDLVLDIQYTPFSTYPGGLASIVGSSPPTLSGAAKSEDTTLAGWTTTLAPGVLDVVVVSAGTITQVTLSLHLGL